MQLQGGWCGVSTRRMLAALSALLISLRLLCGAGGTADRLWRAGRAELEEAAREHTPASPSPVPAAAIRTPAPTPTPEPEPTPDEAAASAPATASFSPDLPGLLAAGPDLSLPADGPQVLILHTHTSEAYTPDGQDHYIASGTARTEDLNYNIVRVGDRLAETLQAQGLTVLHDRTIYDYPSYTGSYSRSGAAVEAALAANPTIRIVIDLHRDALSDSRVVYKTLSEIPDAPCAQVMLLVGTCGSGLEHPDWERHLRLAVYLQNAVDQEHPTLMRPIVVRNSRYNQQASVGSLLLEVGTAGNSLEEALVAARLFAEGFAETIQGQPKS